MPMATTMSISASATPAPCSATAPGELAATLREAAEDGFTTMLPSPDAPIVGRLLAERFGLPFWQVTATASDANRSVLRWCRAITGRRKILVFNGCYHGAVDETFVELENGRQRPTPPSSASRAISMS